MTWELAKLFLDKKTASGIGNQTIPRLPRNWQSYSDLASLAASIGRSLHGKSWWQSVNGIVYGENIDNIFQ